MAQMASGINRITRRTRIWEQAAIFNENMILSCKNWLFPETGKGRFFLVHAGAGPGFDNRAMLCRDSQDHPGEILDSLSFLAGPSR